MVKLNDFIELLERGKKTSRPIIGDLREEGLSFEAGHALEKLKSLPAGTKVLRAYDVDGGVAELVDVLTEDDIAERGYKATANVKTVSGDPPAERDRIVYHTTDDDLYEDVWIGEPLEW